MQTPSGSANDEPGKPEEQPRARHEPPFIVSPYYLSALGVGALIVGVLQQVWPVAAAGAILTAIAIARYLMVRSRR